MNRDSDSPYPLSPTAEAVLDSSVAAEVVADDDEISVVLHEVPSTQPQLSPPTWETSPKVIIHVPSKRETATTWPYDVRLPPPLIPATSMLSPKCFQYPAGRGLLHLRAPPKLECIPAPLRLPLPCSTLPTLQCMGHHCAAPGIHEIPGADLSNHGRTSLDF